MVVRFQERVIDPVVGARCGLDRRIGARFDRYDAGQVDEVGELDHATLVDRAHPVVGDDQQARGLAYRGEAGGQVADALVDFGDRGVHFGAVGTEAVPGIVDRLEIEGDEGGANV